MAASITETVGGASSNSYVTVSEADSYMEERQPSTAWDAATDDEKTRALISATRRIDQEDFRGTPVDPLTGTSAGDTQALKWPRNSATNEEGWTYENDIIPEPVKRATMELAYVIVDDDEFHADSGLEGFDRAKVGALDVDIRHQHRPGELPEHVRRYLAPVLIGSGVNFRVRRG